MRGTDALSSQKANVPNVNQVFICLNLDVSAALKWEIATASILVVSAMGALKDGTQRMEAVKSAAQAQL